MKEGKPYCKLVGTDGNIFALMGRATLALKKAGYYTQRREMISKLQNAKSYDEALGIITEYVDVH